MRKKSFEVEVRPQIIKWAINTSGWSIKDLSQRLIVSESTITKWIKEEKYPTFRQLENLSKCLKRPVAVFLLPNPPEERPLPKDYRTLPEEMKNKFDRNTILALRTARRLQKVSKELTENLNQNIEPKFPFLKLSKNPKEIAELYRNKFQITEEVQKGWKSSYEAFNTLRKLIENLNILVFQFPMPMEDARGFALTETYDTLPVIVMNSKDKIEARIFTLLHEFAHILLGESGIDMPENSLLTYTIGKIEKWCNDFASTFLLPIAMARKLFEQYRSSLTQKNTLYKLSVDYKVSKGMLLYNMKKLNYITKVQYEQKLDKLRKTPLRKSKGGLPPYKKCISQKGRIVPLVTTNLEKGFITTCDALDYLSIKHKQFDKLLSELEK